MNGTWKRFWIAEATREPLMGHCTRWLLRSLELGKETLLQAEPPSKLILTIVGTIAGLTLLPALVLGAVMCKKFSGACYHPNPSRSHMLKEHRPCLSWLPPSAGDKLQGNQLCKVTSYVML
ncbi:uncharacterized protein LOC144340486 [Macaca mulatta]